MSDVTAVRRAVDRLLRGALEPMLDLLAEDVEFQVAIGGDVPGCTKDRGRQPVADYFTVLGGLVAFWQMDYTSTGEQLIAWGRESFAVEHCEIEGGCEFALVFDLSEDMIVRFLVIEDLPSFIRGGGSLGEGSRAGADGRGGAVRLDLSVIPHAGLHHGLEQILVEAGNQADATFGVLSHPF